MILNPENDLMLQEITKMINDKIKSQLFTNAEIMLYMVHKAAQEQKGKPISEENLELQKIAVTQLQDHLEQRLMTILLPTYTNFFSSRTPTETAPGQLLAIAKKHVAQIYDEMQAMAKIADMKGDH